MSKGSLPSFDIAERHSPLLGTTLDTRSLLDRLMLAVGL